MTIDNQLQHILVHFDHHRCHLLSRHEEDDGEKSNLKLWTHTDEGAADGLHQALPAELQVQDVVVFIGLQNINEKGSLMSSFMYLLFKVR